ncbi:MAG: discoidin domain-containing protein [Pseudomonadota bacterium]
MEQKHELIASLYGSGASLTMVDTDYNPDGETTLTDGEEPDDGLNEFVVTCITATGLIYISEKVSTDVYDETDKKVAQKETYTVTFTASRTTDTAQLTGAEAWQNLASNPDLIALYCDSIESARAHFEVFGRNGDTGLGFDAVQYAANYGINDVASAAQHYVTTRHGRGWSDKADITDSLEASAATQSSTHNSSVAAYAIDNDRGTITHAATNDWTPYISIDLGDDHILEAATLQNRHTSNTHWIHDRLIGTKMGVLNGDEVVWTSNPLNDWATQYFNFNDVVGDEVRITHTNRNLSITELEIFGEAFDNAVTNLTDTLDASAASMTSEWADGRRGAENAHDGDDGTLIHPKRGDNNKDFWLDLGTDAKIEYIDIANRADTWSSRLNSAEVQILRDGNEVWSQGLTSAYDQIINTGGVIGDEVRIVQDGALLRIGEIDVYSQFMPNALTNLTPLLTASDVSQSSRLASDTGAEYAIDGDYTLDVHTGHGNHSPWVEFDLGEDTFLKGLLLQNRYMDESNSHFHLNEKLKDAKIEVLDGSTVVWSTLILSDDVSEWGDLNGVIGDKIQVSSDKQYLHFAELEIIGDYLSGMTNITDRFHGSAATQSGSRENVVPASNVLDGTSRINHTDDVGTYWLSVDLGRDVAFEFIEIEDRDDRYYEVRKRLDGATLEIPDDGVVVWESDPLKGSHLQAIDASGVIGDQVRITHENQLSHIAEIDVLGSYMA